MLRLGVQTTERRPRTNPAHGLVDQVALSGASRGLDSHGQLLELPGEQRESFPL